MDSITQGVLGAAIGESMFGKRIGNKAALWGALIATIPDLDIVFYLFCDPIDMLSIHRGFSHSILFSLLGSIPIAYLLRRTKTFKLLNGIQLYTFSFLCLFTHIILDTFTAYGTQLFNPFSNSRVGFDSINVIDPLYTLPLILGLIFSLYFYKERPNRSKFTNLGIIISSLYLLITLANKQNINSIASSNFKKDNIKYQEMMTMPVCIANVNCYAVAKSKDSLHMQKINAFDKLEESIVSFPINDDYLSLLDPKSAEKMRWFSKGFYTVEKEADKIRIYNLQVDMRGYGKYNHKRTPTLGYFEFTIKDGESIYSSGSVPQTYD
jgi:inner membrane protein